MRIKWAPNALTELDSIRRYIQGENPRAAIEVVRRIRAASAILKTHPEAGRPGRLDGTCELVAVGTSYILPYRIADGRIEILSVMHGAQAWPVELWRADPTAE